jgi:hypothetical protein
LNRATVPLSKPVPVIAIFCEAAPALRLEGEMEAIVGTAMFVEEEPDDDPDDGPAEHPVRTRNADNKAEEPSKVKK